MGRPLSIGEAARLAGVSVQTLRHYDALGLLVPSEVSVAGHRRYSERDCERLRLIRTLREVGFDLRSIHELLDGRADPDAAFQILAEALEAEQRTLKRRQLLLRAALKGSRKNVLSRLQRKHVLTKLNRLEREAFLAKHLDWAPRDTPASLAVWQAAVLDLPEQMDDTQLEAWLELAEIAADDRFRKTLERQFELSRGLDESRMLELGRTFQRLMADVMQALREQRAPDDDASRTLVNEWIVSFARLHARAPDAEFVGWLLDRLDTTDDPRINRYWELLSKLKHFPYDPMAARAYTWLRDALRVGAAARR